MVSKALTHFNFRVICGRFYNYLHLRFHDTFRPAGAKRVVARISIHISPRWGCSYLSLKSFFVSYPPGQTR